MTLHAEAALLKEGHVRIVLVGDSITGLSRNHPAGYAHLIEWALKAAYPDCHPDIAALGGSGMGVWSWENAELKSRTQERFLDVEGIPLKATLDQPADVLVIMLGMNDVLAPYVADDEVSYEEWTQTYKRMVTVLQARLKPSITAVATATLCTEDVDSPQNRVMDKLNVRIAKLAEEFHRSRCSRRRGFLRGDAPEKLRGRLRRTLDSRGAGPQDESERQHSGFCRHRGIDSVSERQSSLQRSHQR